MTPSFGPLLRLTAKCTFAHVLRPHPAVLLLAVLACAGCAPLAPEPSATPTPTATLTPTFPFPTLAPSATEAPPKTPVPPPAPESGAGETLYETTFDASNDWPLTRDSFGATSLLQGNLSVVVAAAGATRSVTSPAPPARDFVLQATFAPQLCSPDDEYGLHFRDTPDGGQLRFTVTCSGAVRARRVRADSSRALVPFLDHHAAVMPGAPAQNTLAVRAVGASVRLYVNGVQVLMFSDSEPRAGQTGLVVRGDSAGQTTILVADYLLRALSATPTAEASETMEASDGET